MASHPGSHFISLRLQMQVRSLAAAAVVSFQTTLVCVMPLFQPRLHVPSRTYECHDPSDYVNRNIDLCLAIGSYQSNPHCHCHSIRVIFFYSPCCPTTDARHSFTCGAYVALLPNPMIEFGETGDLGRRIGMFTTIFALGALVGPPISGAIYLATGGFEAVGYYAGMSHIRIRFDRLSPPLFQVQWSSFLSSSCVLHVIWSYDAFGAKFECLHDHVFHQLL
jgi:hypothetical protein